MQSASKLTRTPYEQLTQLTWWVLRAIHTYQKSGWWGRGVLEPEGAFLPVRRRSNTT